MPQRTIMKFVAEVKQTMAEHAESAMLRPKRDLFCSGEASGIYQGMQISLDILDSILSDQLEEELKS
jgi:hypothetical protein